VRHLLKASGSVSKCPRELRHLMLQSKRAMLLGKCPSLSLDGTGGTYFLPDTQGQPVTVFKPLDEEPFACNNPRGPAFALPFGEDDGSTRMRAGIPPGASCFREVAAYLLDTCHHAGVPQTTLAEAMHPRFSYRDRQLKPKLGSLQKFSPSDGVAEDFSSSLFPATEVHKIAILDLRLLNCDRNAGNILVRQAKEPDKASLTLVPIDHGYCLPDLLEIGWCDWCWLDWPQAKQPLSPDAKHHILHVIDPEEDARAVRERFGMSKKVATLVKLSGMLLQEGVRSGLSLYEVASLVVRQDLTGDAMGHLEQVYLAAAQMAAQQQPLQRTAFSMSPSLALGRSSAALAPRLAVDGGKAVVRTGGESPVSTVMMRTSTDDEQQDSRSTSTADDTESHSSPRGFWVHTIESVDAQNALAKDNESVHDDAEEWHDDDDDEPGSPDSKSRRLRSSSSDSSRSVASLDKAEFDRSFWLHAEAMVKDLVRHCPVES